MADNQEVPKETNNPNKSQSTEKAGDKAEEPMDTNNQRPPPKRKAVDSPSTESSVSRSSVSTWAQNPVMYTGKLMGPYDPTTAWQDYELLMKQQFLLRGISDENTQKAILMTEIGMKAFAELRNSLEGNDPLSVPLSHIWEALRKRYSPKKLLVAERYRMTQLRQKTGQTLNEFYSELQESANKCEFDKVRNVRDMMILQTLLRGIQCETTRAKLLQREELTASQALEHARLFEQAETEAHGMADNRATVSKLDTKNYHRPDKRNHKSHAKSRNSRFSRRDQQRSCRHCGKPHASDDCWHHPEAECQLCGKKGHKARACTRNQRHNKPHGSHNQRRTNQVAYEESDNTEERDVGNVLAVSEPKEPPARLKVHINGKQLTMELDTGAAVTLIRERDWEYLGKPPLESAGITLTGYDRKKIETMGYFRADCALNKRHGEVTIYVSTEGGSALCGRTMIRALQIDCGPHYNTDVHDVEAEEPKEALTLEQILKDNEEVFQDDGGTCQEAASLIFKKDAKPRFFKARPVPYALKPKIEANLQEAIEQGVYSPVDTSEWATPIVCVPKPDNKIRVCGDYKVTVNTAIEVNQYPIPKAEDIFHALNGGQKFSKIDLKNAYLQIPLDEESQKACTIITHKGLYRPNRMPFGVASAPAIFQKIMDQRILQGIEGAVAYLDDITVTGRTDQEHLERLARVLHRLKTYGLRAKKSKCEFLKEKVELLGHIVSADGIETSPKKVEDMKKMPAPKNLKEVESFLGMVQYYSKFVPNLSSLAAPLNELKRKGVEWRWTKTEQDAFKAIKDKLISAPCLTHFDPNEEVVLATDASEYGLGAVIFHRYKNGEERVIAHASRTLSQTERKYAQIEKEALGIIFGIERFNEYLYGRKFTLFTDHQPLVKIFGPKNQLPVVAAKRLHRWALKLMMYSFNIQYKSTHEFGNADCLSRLPNPMVAKTSDELSAEVHVLEQQTLAELPIKAEDIAEETRKDIALSEVLKYIRKGWPEKCPAPYLRAYFVRRANLSEHDGCILKDNQVVIPPAFRENMLKLLHTSHAGIVRMKSLARKHMWFPRMEADIEEISHNCNRCAEAGPEMAKTPLHLWDEPERVWQRLHIDFCGPEQGFMWLVIVDAKSKWPEVVKMTSTTTKATLEKLTEVFSRHGLPEAIVSDNGPQLASEEFKSYCQSRGIRHILTPPFHPASNGLAERFVQTFKSSLKKNLKDGKSLSWVVSEILLQYRITPHPATGKTPAEFMVTHPIRTLLDIIKPQPKVDQKPQNGTTSAYRERMKRDYDKKTRERTINAEDLVYARDYTARHEKWVPAKVIKRLGGNTFLVKTDRGTWKRSTNQLKKRHDVKSGVFSSPTPTAGFSSALKTKESRSVKKGKNTVRFSLPEEEEETTTIVAPYPKEPVEQETPIIPGTPTIDDYFPQVEDQAEEQPAEAVRERLSLPLAQRRERREIRLPPGREIYKDSSKIKLPAKQMARQKGLHNEEQRKPDQQDPPPPESINAVNRVGTKKPTRRTAAYQRRQELRQLSIAIFGKPVRRPADWSLEED